LYNLFNQSWQLLVFHPCCFTSAFSCCAMDPWLSYLDRALLHGKALGKEVYGDADSIGYKHLNQFDK
jgi:hypothetical protein